MAAADATRKKAWTSVDQRVQSAVSPGDFRRIADARRQMWTSGFIGMAGGLAAGVAAFIVTRRIQPAKKLLPKTHGVFFALAGLSAGGYLGAVSSNSIAKLGDMFERWGAREGSYQHKVLQDQAAAAGDAAVAPAPADGGHAAGSDVADGGDRAPAAGAPRRATKLA